jgi:hypothetical protein
MKKLRRVLLCSMGLALVALIGLTGAGAAAPEEPAAALEEPTVAPAESAVVPEEPAAAPAESAAAPVTAAGQPSECGCEDELSCSCACSPLAGSWVASLQPKEDERDGKATDGKDTRDAIEVDSAKKKVRPLLKTFKFAPVNTKCDKFVVNAQALTRPERVIRCFPEVTDLTEFVGIACKAESYEINFTAIGYGIERGKEEDKTVFIAVLSGTIALPKESAKDGEHYKCKCCEDSCKDSKCTCKNGDYNDKDHPDKCSCCKNGCKYSDCECKTGKYGKNYGKEDEKDKDQKCNEPEKLYAELTVAYFDAEVADEDGDGFPDSREEPLICLPFKAEFKRIELQPQCKPSKTPTVDASADAQG